MLQIGRSLVRSQLVSLEFLIDVKPFRSHYGPGFYSAFNRNEYQAHFLRGKIGRCVRLTTLPPFWAVVTQSGNLNFLENSGHLGTVMGLIITLCELWMCWYGHEQIFHRFLHGWMAMRSVKQMAALNTPNGRFIFLTTESIYKKFGMENWHSVRWAYHSSWTNLLEQHCI